jgi:primosomal protein N' (replication factor Y) (superfamily II helicase)
MSVMDKHFSTLKLNKKINKSCQVLLIYPGKGVYDYKLNNQLEIGQIVSVPLRKQIYQGIVIGDGDKNFPKSKLKKIIKIHNFPLISLELLGFCFWLSSWYMSDKSQVIKMVLPAASFLNPIKNKLILEFNKESNNKTTILGTKVVKHIKNNPNLTISECSKANNVSHGVIKKLIKDKVLLIRNLDLIRKEKTKKENIPLLNSQQKKAVKNILSKSKKNDCNTFLLDGVTGSGKTEVYLEIISREIKKNKQCLVLIPEIVLSNHFIKRFEERFNFLPSIWHSEISKKNKHKAWRDIINGDVKVVIGARSALFLPFSNLSVIVVDEEHDASYKQDDGIIYNARDMAVVRGRLSNSKVILGSATPSLESIHNAEIGKYIKIELSERYGLASMPIIDIIDMQKEKLPSNKWIANESIKAIKKALENKEQVLLYINRRGYSPLTLCRSCGYRFSCINCSSWLVNHKKTNTMLCHHCGYQEKIIYECPNCNSKEEFAPCGPGVERLAAEAKLIFSNAKLEIIASDTLNSSIESKNIFQAISQGKVDIIIGTQLVAKGHNFPNLTTIIAVDADLGLSGGDLRASERTFQMLTQLAGRAGRVNKKGYAYIQSYDPNHNVMKAIQTGKIKNFINAESKGRNFRNLPPYGRLGALIIQSSDLHLLEGFNKILSSNIPKLHKDKHRIDVLGPAPAPLTKLRKFYRYRFLIKGKDDVKIQSFIREWLKNIKLPKGIRLKIDIDPYNFL